MLTLDEALAVIARLGSDDQPGLDDLTAARDAVARELHALRGRPNVDLEALMSLRDTYAVAAEAVTAAHAAANEAASQVEDLLADVPDPDATDEAPEATETTEPVAAGARVLSVREAVARLGLAPTRTEPRPDPVDTLATTRTTVHLGGDEVPTATFDDLAREFSRSARNQRTGRERVARIETTYSAERTLPGKIAENTRLVDSFVSPEAVAAAGGCCSLPTPIYENPVGGDLNRPIRASLPTIGATRGKVVFYPAICLPVDGVGNWDCEQDAAVDSADPDTWKTCAEVECDDEVTADVEAIYTCITVGNFQQRFNPELWAGHLRALSVMQTRVAEQTLWGKMMASVTSTHTGQQTGSVYVNLLDSVSLAAAAMRQTQRISSLRFNLWLPEWILSAARADLRARRVDSNADQIEVTDQMIRSAFANEGIDVIFSPDVDPIEPNGQPDGPLQQYPDEADAILAPNGYFSFLDGGTLDFGTEIRDHDLNRQNRLAAFAESFEGLMARGCAAKAIKIPVEVCGQVCDCAPAATTSATVNTGTTTPAA